ncbi:sensor histidine kinase [Desnuesiella massiliensis]|uniref:sensor histidine kinase n=1 Tax=Desnuesiella massiliensis TaxID=1650662 RepID=UPI0006E14503|nr:sensor histidine kinase [Desnuesiella massiliensis]
MKTLSSRIKFIYLILLLILILVSSFSILNLWRINNGLNKFMNNNYHNISRISELKFKLEDLNRKVFLYSHSDKNFNISDAINEYTEGFYGGTNNIDDKDIAENLNRDYKAYVNYLMQIEIIRNKYGQNESSKYFNDNVQKAFYSLDKNLDYLIISNEASMFESKSSLYKTLSNSSVIILIFSIIIILGGFLICSYMLKKFLAPVNSLITNIASIKEGNFDVEFQSNWNNEMGIIAKEFNEMLSRIRTYEESSYGKLTKEKDRFLAIIESIKDPLCIINKNKTILLYNQAFKNIFILNQDKDIDLSSIIDSSLKKDDSADNIMKTTLNKNNHYFIPHKSLMTLDEKYFILTFQDITPIKQAEGLKSQFISTISHEIKTPLTSMLIGISLLKDSSAGIITKPGMNTLNNMEEDIESLSELITNMLHMSKIEYEKSRLCLKECSIIGIIENSIRDYDKLNSREINLYYEADEDLPKIIGDEEKLEWVIHNLLDVHLKFAKAGDEFCISAYKDLEKVFISIKSTGINIENNYFNDIFGEFSQLQGRDFEFRASGLSLSLSKKIIKLQNGDIFYEKFTNSFTFSVPISQGKE